MKTPPRPPVFCLRLALAVALLAAASAHAGERAMPNRSFPAGEGHGARHILLADSGISIEQAQAMAERRFKAKVISKEVRQEGDRKIYVLRLYNEKESWIVRVDAQTGQMSR